MAPPNFSPIFVFSLFFIGVFIVQAHHQDSTYFTYEGSHGPAHWGSLCPNYTICANGKSQSPINIVKGDTAFSRNLQTIDRRYNPANATLVNNGYNIGVHFGENSGGAVVDGKSYRLKQLHWHSPSEHRLNGVRFAAELHLLHQADDGSFSVIAILLRYGAPDPLLAKIESKLVELANEKRAGDEQAHIALGRLDAKHLKQRTRKYYRYHGSLTSPPCTENVAWNILGKVRTISKKQVELLKAPLDPVFKNNYRPEQPLNGRKIEIYDERNRW